MFSYYLQKKVDRFFYIYGTPTSKTQPQSAVYFNIMDIQTQPNDAEKEKPTPEIAVIALPCC